MISRLVLLSACLLLSPVAAAVDADSETEFSFFDEEQPVAAASVDGASEDDDSFSFFTDEEPAPVSKSTLNYQVAVPVKPDKKVPLSFRINGELGVYGAFDILHDQAGEEVSELQSFGLLTAEGRLGHFMRLYANFALYWGYRGQRPADGTPYLLFNTSETRYQGGFDLLETFAEFNLAPGLFLRVGNLNFSWGQNDFLPAVALNPLDGRRAYPHGFQLHAPVPAVDLAWTRKWFTARLAFIPWFRPHQVALTDKDISLAPAGSAFREKLSLLDKISPTLLQALVDDPLATDPPDNSLKNSTVGLRLEAETARADFALSVVYGWDRTPQLVLDENLLLLAGRAGDLLADPGLFFSDAEISAAFLQLQNNYAAGETLFKLAYMRQLTVAYDMAVQLGNFVLKLDVAFAPHKVFYDADLQFSRTPFLQSALAVEYNYGTSLYLSLTAFALFSFDNELIPLLDFKMMSRNSSYLVGFFFLGRKTFLEERLKLETMLVISATYGDFLWRTTLEYKLRERHVFGLGVTFIYGPEGSLGQRYTAADNIFTYYRWLF